MLAACGEGSDGESSGTGGQEEGAGSNGSDDGGDGDGDLEQVRVGYIPAGIYAYLWHAQDEGYFEEEGLEVELVTVAGGGEVVPALEAGELDFGISDAMGVLNARNQGIPATYVSLNFAQSEDDPVHAAMSNNPDVEGPEDLEGGSVATNLSFNTDWIMMRKWLRQNDVDPESVSFQEIAFPDMVGALRDGSLSAAGLVEPFYAQAAEEGYTVLGHYFTEVQSPILFTGLISLETYVEENPETAESFVSVVERAIEDFNEDEQLARDVIEQHTELDPSVIEEMNLGTWTTSAEPADMQFWVQAAQDEGILEEDIELESLVWQP